MNIRVTLNKFGREMWRNPPSLRILNSAKFKLNMSEANLKKNGSLMFVMIRNCTSSLREYITSRYRIYTYFSLVTLIVILNLVWTVIC